jgi:hypothetical protein
MNVVDSVGKQAHFISTNTTITALGAASLFLQNVWKLHGLSHNIVSDHGPQFIVEFTQELYRLLGTTLSTTMAYPSGRWADGACQPGARIVSPGLCQ